MSETTKIPFKHLAKIYLKGEQICSLAKTWTKDCIVKVQSEICEAREEAIKKQDEEKSV
ncbi:unnamed protein product [marine sediment metagenome]|uniref:Uncharacterized protein n=1 Tax=marine sediment metagenome TaxID=412755 RepID=X0SD41_9ZZZZ